MSFKPCVPGTCLPPHPHRGGDGGKQRQYASLPVVPKGSGKLASLEISTTSGACRDSRLPPHASLPLRKATTTVRQAQKRLVSQARAEFDRNNLEAARIIVADPAKYAGGCLEWAHAV